MKMKSDKNRLYRDVEFLTSIYPARNYLNTESLKKVSRYIFSEFDKAGLSVEEQKWIADGQEYQNIIASFNRDKSRRLVVGAHYDVCGDQPGADDNASAIAGLIELVRMVGKNNPGIDYRIDFVAYCLEEPPFFGSEQMGSYQHAKFLRDNNVDVIGMICLEMIGYFSDEPESQSFPEPGMALIYLHVANFIVVVGLDQYSKFTSQVHQSMLNGSAIDVQFINFPNMNGLAGLSDQRNYWKMGYPAVMINDTSFIRNPNYHRQSDAIETLDFDKMNEVVSSCYEAIVRFGQ